MRVLVDTHAFFWWVVTDENLSAQALDVLEDEANDILVSSVVAWELSTKARLGKWPSGKVVADNIDQYIEAYSLKPLAITIAHARLGGSMAGQHRDPFDRLLAAQARLEQIPLVTADRAFQEFDVEVLW